MGRLPKRRVRIFNRISLEELAYKIQQFQHPELHLVVNTDRAKRIVPGGMATNGGRRGMYSVENELNIL